MPSFLKTGTKFGHRLEVGVRSDVFVVVDDRGALSGFDLHREYLFLEIPAGGGLSGAAMAFDRQRILFFPGDTPLRCHILGGNTHRVVVERIRQPTGYRIDKLAAAHPLTPAVILGEVGAAAHGLRTARHRAVSVAQHDRLRGIDNGLQTRCRTSDLR